MFGDTNKLESYIEQAKKIRKASTEVEAGALLYSIICSYINQERLAQSDNVDFGG